LSAVFFSESDEEINAVKYIKPYCDLIKLVPFRKDIAYLNSMFHSFSMKPLQIWYWHSHQMQRTIDELVDQYYFDIIHAQFFRMAQYAVKFTQCSKVLDLGDAMSLNLHRRAKLDKSMTWPLVKLEEFRVRKYETEIVKHFDVGTMVSDFDRDYLLELDDNLNLEVVPMGVDLEYFQPSDTKSTSSDCAESTSQLLFTGTMNYFPNYDAVWYFYHNIFPYIQQTHPDVIFYVVGNYPTAKLKKLEANRDIVVTGHVPETRPHFDQSAVFVSPLRGGSGVQVKNLEAMAMGLPVVTTSVGAAGIEAKIGHHLMVADEPKEFAARVVQLLDDPELRRQIGQNGRHLVEQKYNWQDVVNRLDKIYEQIGCIKRKT
jgi:sugar transferase (PEP-CTERM/EpsH1 system associated)